MKSFPLFASCKRQNWAALYEVVVNLFCLGDGKIEKKGGGKKGRKGKKEKGDGVDVALNENPPFVWVGGPERQQ